MAYALTTQSLGRKDYQGDMTSSQLRAAGVTTRLKESVKDAMTWGERPQTPADQKKYRLLSVHEPGKIARHYGAADDPVPEGPFGAVSKTDESVAATLKGNFPTTEMGRWQLEQSEDVYARCAQWLSSSSTSTSMLCTSLRGRVACLARCASASRTYGMTIAARSSRLLAARSASRSGAATSVARASPRGSAPTGPSGWRSTRG